MRKECKAAIAATEKGGNNCPIVLQKLTFNIFSHYLATRRTKANKYLSKTSYGGERSALMHLYRLSGETISEDFNKLLREFLSGMKRTATQSKVDNGESLDEGKKPMSFEVYKEMCQLLMRGDGDDYLFAHTFLTLEWNLLARSDNCLSMHINHIEWREDCLVFFFAKSKGNQTGENSEHPWHVYSNPENPSICPVMALAKYLFSQPDILKNNGKLFPGDHQYERFIDIFHRVIDDNSQRFQSLGVAPRSLGSHSCRKGAISLVSSGCTVSPPMASICLRACWSMGPVKDRYIHYEKAGDQFVGRTVTGISSLLKEFAISPVYFNFCHGDPGSSEKIDYIIENNLIRKSDTSPTMFNLARFLFASLCFHYDFLDRELHSMNKLRGSPMFIESFPWNKSRCTPVFTGVPPHVLLMASLESMKNSLDLHRENIVSELKEELDLRHVGGDAFRASSLLTEVQGLHKEISSIVNRLVRENNDNILPPLQMNDNAQFENENYLRIIDDEDEALGGDNNDGTHNDTGRRKQGGLIISWDNCRNGKMKLLPRSYIFPKLSLPNLVTMWYCGDKSKNIPPYKVLRSVDVSEIKGGRQKLWPDHDKIMCKEWI